MNIVVLLLTLMVGIFILIGYIFADKFKDNKRFTDFSISLAFGVIIALIVLELIPEVHGSLKELLDSRRAIILIIVLILIGIYILKILDSFIPHHVHEEHHDHKHKNDDCYKEHLKHVGIISSAAIIIHNIIEGMSLYIVSSNSIISGLLMCIGIGLHNIPLGLVVGTTLSNSNYNKKDSLNIIILVSISTFIGGLIMFILGSVPAIVEAILLGITLGMLIYISLFELLHQIYHMKNTKISRIGICFGIILLIICLLIKHHI